MGTAQDKTREGRIGHWSTQWSRDETKSWRINRFEAKAETVTRARQPIFIDITSQTGQTDSYKKQMLHGVDHWRTVWDSAIGFDVYGNNGVAVGDIDNGGFDDLYICQPSGLPNRLYRNRGDGTFEDVTEIAELDVLDNTACALFADFENKGLQDLLVVSGNGPLLFVNQGNGKFGLKRDAFKFARRRKAPSPTLPSPTTTATAASTCISACTATTSDSISITIPLLTSTHAMARPTFYFTTKATLPSKIGRKPQV